MGGAKVSAVPAGGSGLALFDLRPIKFPGFRLTAQRAEVVGDPSLAQWTRAVEFAAAVEDSAPYWLGDLLVYADTRLEWTEALSQALSHVTAAEHTLENAKYVAGHVGPEARAIAPSKSHAAEVAALSADDQVRWLDVARTEGWTRRDLRMALQASKRRRIVEGQAVLEGMYRVLYADPGWEYAHRPPSGVGASEHSTTMSVEQLCRLPVAAHALPDAVLFLWVTAPTILQAPGPREVAAAWGFADYKQQYIWDKVDGTFSHYTGGNHEILTIWTRGSCLPDVPINLPDSVQVIRKSHVHSAKPPEFRELIRRHWTHGPYVELFAVEQVPGWDYFGDDARLWPSAVAPNPRTVRPRSGPASTRNSASASLPGR